MPYIPPGRRPAPSGGRRGSPGRSAASRRPGGTNYVPRARPNAGGGIENAPEIVRESVYRQRAEAAANELYGPGPVDPYAGATIFDMLAGMGPNQNGGGGGSRRGGGGGGGGGATAASQAAYKQMLDALKAQQGANAGIFDQRNQTLTAAQQAGKARLDGILAELTAGAAATRGKVGESYANTGAQMRQMADQFAAEEAQRAYGAGQTLSMFGGSPAQIDRGYGAVDTMRAQMGLNAQLGGAADAMYAGRGNVYNGLMGDASTANSQMFDQLLAQLAAQKQQQALADQQAQAQLAIQAAGAGVKL